MRADGGAGGAGFAHVKAGTRPRPREREAGMIMVLVLTGIHVTAHQGWDIDPVRARGNAISALLAELQARLKRVVRDEFPLVVGERHIAGNLHVLVDMLKPGHAWYGGADVGLLQDPFQHRGLTH